jgi:DNA topoisomerase VI subunit B
MTEILSRVTAEISRSSEFFSVDELTKQTGQPVDMFAAVIIKELMDNGLDAAETAGRDPQIVLTVCNKDGSIQIRVEDNGNGIRQEVLDRIVSSFDCRISDKVIYRAPSRGSQGNAFKTLIGIPHALRSSYPVVIEALGLRHEIRAQIDPLGNAKADTTSAEIDGFIGTRVEVTLPDVPAAGSLVPEWWAQAFALTNPHALVKFCRIDENLSHDEHGNSSPEKIQEIYQPTVKSGQGWRKFMPTDLTAPVWYSADTLRAQVFAHILSDDVTLRDFVKRFKGLSANAKAKAVCDKFPSIRRLSDFEDRPELISDLLEAMKEIAESPSENVLGYIGKEHIKRCFSEWFGIKRERFWYRRSAITVDGIPYIIEAAVAEVEAENGVLFHGLNFSPTFSDPLASARISAEKVAGYGFRGFLHSCYIDPEWSNDSWYDNAWLMKRNVVAVIHIVSPALQFTDRGKTNPSLPDLVLNEVGSVLWSVAKELYKEGERLRRDAAREERRQERLEREQRQVSCTVKEAVFMILPEAIEIATDKGRIPVRTRDLFYSVRPLIQEYTDDELDWGYFSQGMLVEFQQLHGKIKNLRRDPRGYLYVPHTGQEIPLGTKEVEEYEFPEWVYDKILYIEKKGFADALMLEKVDERYDMAIVAAEGYATEAIRILFQNADRNTNYKLFVLHDADPYGYNIARTLREETRRMPGYKVDVIDLGLKLQEALDMGLQSETFTRKRALPSGLELTEFERKYFVGEHIGGNVWRGTRVELNAIPPKERAAHVECKLAERGATAKVVPPEGVMHAKAEETYGLKCRELIEKEIRRALNIDGMVAAAQKGLGNQNFIGDLQHIREELRNNPPDAWNDLVDKAAVQKASRDVRAQSLKNLIRDLQKNVR